MKNVIDVGDIVAAYLYAHGYHGLHCDECACLADDLAPCGDFHPDCMPGWMSPCTCGDHDYHISHDRPASAGVPDAVLPSGDLGRRVAVLEAWRDEFMLDKWRCRTCGKQVEEARRVYAVPTCYACLPPPPPIPVRPVREVPKCAAEALPMLDVVTPGNPWWFWCLEVDEDIISAVIHKIIRDGSGGLWVSGLSTPKRVFEWLAAGNRIVGSVAQFWGNLSEQLRAQVAVVLQQLSEDGNVNAIDVITVITELSLELGATLSMLRATSREEST